MPGGTSGWLVPTAPHVTRTETGYVTHGIPVSFQQVNSPDGEEIPTRYTGRLYTLLEEYGAVCREAEAVFPIGSVYRSLEYQQQCFRRSGRNEHTLVRGLDMLPLPGWTPRRMAVYAVARRRDPASRLGNIGIAPGWLHLDIAPIAHRVLFWWKTNGAAD